MRQTLLTKITAPIIAIIYLVAVFGFDIHQCGDTDRVFIEPLFSGISCEDIHPGVECHHHCHCHHHHHDGGACHEEGESCLPEEDCHDSVECISITGDDQQTLSVPPFFMCAVLLQPCNSTRAAVSAPRHHEVPVKAPPRAYLLKLDILRV